jgi:hypothetical protein
VLSGCLTEFPPLATETSPSDLTSDAPSSPVDTATSTAGASTGLPDGGGLNTDVPDGSVSDPSDTPSASSSPPDATSATCGAGETACNGVCVRGNSCCATPCEAANAQSECRDEQCVIVECEDDFYDCDGEFANGCETSLPSASATWSEESPFVIPRFDYEMGIGEIDQAAWVNVPRYNLDRRCPTCERNEPPEEVPPITPAENRGTLPSRSDFRGSFALAWNDVGLWVNVVVIDNEWIAGEDVGATDPRRYDNVMVVWDNTPGSSDAGSGNDRILYAGIDGRLKDWRQTTANGASIRVTGANQCRSIHLQLSSQFLFMGSGGSQLLQPGGKHGLNIGYNDFDWVVQGGNAQATRQHFVFGFDMSFSSGDYFAGNRVLPQIELSEP